MSAINEFKDMPLSEFSETESASESTPVEKIPEYVPTQWVDETEPDIDADHLNHIEDGIKKVTDGVNNIIENGGGSFVPSDGYVYIDQEESEENPDPVDVPLLDADTFGGQLPSYYAPQHEISDAFSEGKNYVAGDYCIFSNTLHRFTSAKPAGAWDGTKAVPVTVMGEMRQVPNILFGSYSFALTTEEKTHEVIFDTPFLSVPVIVASIARDGFTENTKFLIRNDVSENRFRFTAIDTSGYEINRNVKLYWIAIAKN